MPLNPKQLQAIYTGDDGEDDGKPKPNPRGLVSEATSAPTSSVQFGQTSNVNVQDYDKYLTSGVYSDQNIDIQRGQKQTILDKLGIRLGNAIPNMAANVLDMVGQLGTLGQFGDNRTYDNAFTRAAQEIRDPFGELYNRTDHSTVLGSLSDPTWWIDQAVGLGEFIIPLSAEGKFMGAFMDNVATKASKLLDLGAEGTQTARMLGGVGTSSLISYQFGAQGGAHVFDQTYQYQLQKLLDQGVSPDDAHKQATHIAAQSAATTVQLSTMLGILLGMGGSSQYFAKTEDVSADILRKEMQPLPGETSAETAERVRQLQPENYIRKLQPTKSLLHKTTEAGRMGLEMGQLTFSQKTGEELGRSGKTENFIDQLGELENFYDRVSGTDGILAFVIGAASGLGLDFMRSNVLKSQSIDKLAPDGTFLQRTDKNSEPMVDEHGAPVYKQQKITPKAYNEMMAVRKFSSLRDAVAEDLDDYQKRQQTLLKAVSTGDPLKIADAQRELFDVHQMNAVRTSMTEPWIKTYQDIAGLSPEEAMQHGFIKNPEDTEYKQKAQAAISDLQQYDKVYKDLQKKYGTLYQANEGGKALVDMVFNRKADLISWKKLLDDAETEVTKNEQEEYRLAQVANPDEFDQTITDYNRQYDSHTIVYNQLKSDFDKLKTAIDTQDKKTMLRLVRKYRAKGLSENDLQGSVNDLSRRLGREVEVQNQKLDAARETMIESTDYAEWKKKNEKGKFEDYVSEVHRRSGMSLKNLSDRGSLEEAKIRYRMADRSLSEILEEKTFDRFAKKASDWMRQVQEETDAASKLKNDRLSDMVKDKSTLDKMQRQQLNEVSRDYEQRHTVLIGHISKLRDELTALNKEIAGLSSIKSPLKKLGLIIDRNVLVKYIKELEDEATNLEAKAAHYRVDTSTPDRPVPVDKVSATDKEVDDTTEESDNAPVPIVDEPLVDKEMEALFMQLMDGTPAVELPELPKDTTATQAYYKLISPLPETMSIRMGELESAIRSGEKAFSLDMLNPEIAAGTVSQAQATKLLQAMKEYMDEEDRQIQEAQAAEASKEERVLKTEEAEPNTVDFDGPGIPDSPVISITDEAIAQQEPGTQPGHAGLKTINALSLANSTIAYTEGFNEKKNAFVKIPDPTKINPKTNPDILKGDRLLPGYIIRLEVDTNFDGDINFDDDLHQDEYGQRDQLSDKFENYADSNGKVQPGDDKIGNVPIRVVDAKTNKVIGYMRRVDWVTAKYPDTKDYRNVVDKLYDEDGNPMDNIKEQVDNLMLVRRHIVEQFNSNGRYTDAKIEDKGTGRIILNRETNLNSYNSKVVPRLARGKIAKNSMLPDPDLKIGILQGGKIYTGYNHEFDRSKGYTDSDLTDYSDGNVMVMLPTANGKHLFAPLTGQKLAEGDRRSAVTSVARAIEMYLLHDGSSPTLLAEMKELQRNTGFDIRTEAGLRNFINQYFTYTQNFKESDTAANAPAPKKGPKREKFLFNISDRVGTQNKGQIRLGWSYSGRPIVDAKITRGKLDDNFVKALEEGFQSRSRAVVYTDEGRNLRGINETNARPFKDVIVTADGKWRYTEYPSYNEYVKSFSKTIVYGRNQLEDGTYVYTANPSIPIEVSTVKKYPTALVVENASPTKPAITETSDKYDAKAASAFDELANFSVDFTPKPIRAEELGTAPGNAKELTPHSLEEMYNFTPTDQRNGKTPRQVYDELSSRGHTFLPDGFNPFTRCL